jgi:hypothetical protein
VPVTNSSSTNIAASDHQKIGVLMREISSRYPIESNNGALAAVEKLSSERCHSIRMNNSFVIGSWFAS